MENSTVASDKRRHDGEWIAAEWVANRLRPFTGIWSCCGHEKRVSLFCKSDGDRLQMQEKWEEKRRNDEELTQYKSFANSRRAAIEEQMKRERENDLYYFQMLSTDQNLNSPKSPAVSDAAVERSGGNAAMVLLWTHKCLDDEFLAQKSVEELLKLTESAAEIRELLRQNCTFTLATLLEKYPANASIASNVAHTFGNLLNDSAAGAELLADSSIAGVVQKLISAVLVHQSQPHVLVPAFNALRKAAEKTENALLCVDAALIEYSITVCQIHKRDVDVLTAAMRLVHALGSNDGKNIGNEVSALIASNEAVKRSVKAGALGLGMHVLKRHRDKTQVLCAAVELLQLLVERDQPAAAEYLLRKKLVTQLLELEKTIHALPDNEKLHLHALQLMKHLSLHPKGAEQIAAYRGGWQALGAFTPAGDELLHMLDGHMHNPGWTIGETRYLPQRERRKYGREDPMPQTDFSEHWTVSSLNQFMGRSMKPITLPEEVDSNRFFFELIKLLGLLPHKDEDKEDWFKRVKAYERSNGVVLAEVIEAVRHVHHLAAENSSEELAQRLTAAADISDEAVEFELMSPMQRRRHHTAHTNPSAGRS